MKEFIDDNREAIKNKDGSSKIKSASYQQYAS
jgi:hypothetical protein